jgi:hypothetical protein
MGAIQSYTLSLSRKHPPHHPTSRRIRGVTEELGEYLRHLIYDKEQREYVAWLERVKSFVK